MTDIVQDYKFISYKKTGRVSGPWMITEKIDGCNMVIFIDEKNKIINAGSRHNWLTYNHDHFDFNKWVKQNANFLIEILGDGYHFGEWYGHKIQRNYKMTNRKFALFDAYHYQQKIIDSNNDIGLTTVPVLEDGCTNLIDWLNVKNIMSTIGPVQMEGVVAKHWVTNEVLKIIFNNQKQQKHDEKLKELRKKLILTPFK